MISIRALKDSKFLRDFFVYVPSTLAPLITALGSLLIFVRMMTPSVYGEYVIAVATVNLTVQIFAEWISTTTMRLYGEAADDAAAERILGSLLVCLAVSTLLCNIFVVFSLLIYQQTGFLLWSCVLTVLMVIGRFTTSVVRADHRKWLFVGIMSGGSLLGFGIGILLLVTLKRPELVLAGTAAGTFLQLIPFLVLPRLRRALKHAVTHGAPIHDIKAVLSFGIPVMLSGVGAQLLTFADRFMLAKMKGSAEAGFYSANYSIGEKAIGMAFVPICTASYPLVVRAWQERNWHEAGRVLQHASRLYLLYAIPACLVLIFGREWISGHVLTSAFESAGAVIPLVGMGIVAWNMGTLFHFGLEMQKKTGTITRMVIGAALLNILLNLLWIPRYGATGAGWATFLSYLGYGIASWLVNRFYVRFSWFPTNRAAAMPDPAR